MHQRSLPLSRERRSDPSSYERNCEADPESLDMKTIIPIGISECISFLAVVMGPTQLVRM